VPRVADPSEPIFQSPTEPLRLQAEQAKADNGAGVLRAAHQADLPSCRIERLRNLGAPPATGLSPACFPLKIARGSADPARAVAIMEA
jgi:kynurenine formamidase